MSATTRPREPLEGKRRHKLLPVEVQRKLPKIGAQDGKGMDAIVHLKLFCPYGRGTWYITEGEPSEDGDWLFFGYAVSMGGPDGDELGYSSFTELAETAVFGGAVPAIERDCHFPEGKTIRECVDGHA